MFLVLLGAPGAGKGTISKMLEERKKFIHISSGDLFREIANKKNKSKKEKRLKKTIDSGKLVSDEMVFEVIVEQLLEYDLEKDNLILDGVPRTINQAFLLSKFISEYNVDNVYYINFKIPLDMVRKRIANRVVCPNCSTVYNSNELKVGDKCKKCQTPLIKRADDAEDKMEYRFKEYEEKTKPLLDYYQNMLINVDASIGKESTYDQIITKLGI